MLFDVAQLIFGGVVLYVGAEWLVGGSSGLARAFGVRPLVIGLTIVAYGTSSPELAVSVAARLDGSSQIVLGNVIGSCIANLALILGLTALLRPPFVDPRLFRREIPILVLSVAAVPLVLLNGVIGMVEAALLLAVSVIFTIWTLFSGAADQPEPHIEAVTETAGAPTPGGKVRMSAITAFGLALLIGGGEVFVRGAVGTATALGVSERLIGMTVIAIGTSLPELVTSLIAARRGESDLAIGNVIGSNIFNVFFILGVTPFVGAIEAPLADLQYHLYFLGGVTLLGVLFMRGNRSVSRIEGSLLLASYTAFVVIAGLQN